MNIPQQLYSNEIIGVINDQLEVSDCRSIDDFDEIHKDKLVSLALKAFGYDVEIILSQEANEYLAKYLSTYDQDYLIEFNHLSKRDAYEHFYSYFDQLVNEQIQ